MRHVDGIGALAGRTWIDAHMVDTHAHVPAHLQCASAVVLAAVADGCGSWLLQVAGKGGC